MRTATVQQLARDCGFELAGVAPAAPLSDAESFLEWVAAGMAGSMGYLTDHRAHLRQDPRLLLPTARSVICVAKVYKQAQPAPHIAQYAVADDYHGVMKRGLEALAEKLRDAFGNFDFRAFVDTGPLLERSLARLAGLGWIGRNTCLINQERGSWLFLGELLTSLPLTPDSPAPDRCGTCTRCVEACPTDALRPGGLRTVLDSTRCISYYTIEHRGAIPEPWRESLGDWVFGCDICQDVCPWNRRATETTDPLFTSAVEEASLEELASLSPDEFRSRFRRTPIWRSKYSGFVRNVAIAMGNSGDSRYRPILDRLAGSEDPVIAEHAAWALGRLKEEPACV
ncbi:MAG TPA: tRNA epoxyqueuosine(34) reductase QueG [Bryobacteraceae bacterium]|nr:tRNA epoxyqueuosine(34) reductase QueG [Bryobacteraceae bacterium]